MHLPRAKKLYVREKDQFPAIAHQRKSFYISPESTHHGYPVRPGSHIPLPLALAQHHKPQLEQQERRTRVHNERLSGLP